MEKLVLIDGNSLINRAFYAMPPLSTKDGVPTNAVYGFMNMFFKMLGDINPSFVAVAFDLKAPTFRHKLFKDYKGTRKPMPDDLRPQIPLLKEVLNLMGVKTIELEGYEADDIIGTMAKNTDIKTIIFTGDKDSFQLVDEQTEVRFTKRGITDVEIYNNQNFFEKTRLNPSQIIELKALMGDSSDNIPGVSGIGEKTALNLLAQFSSLDGIYENIDSLKGKTREKIERGKESAYLSRTLATIDTNAPIDCDLQKIVMPKTFSMQVKKKFIELEFRTLASKDIFESKEEKIQEEKKETIIYEVKNLSELEQIIGKEVCLYIGKNSISIATANAEYQVKYRLTLLDEGFDLTEILEKIKGIFNQEQKLIVFSKKETRLFMQKNTNITLSSPVEDISILKYLADYTGGGENAEQVIESYGEDLNAPALSLYNIYITLKEKLKELQAEKLYYDLELPLADVLFEMEVSGFKVKKEQLFAIGEEFKKKLKQKEDIIKQLSGESDININSPLQLGELLFNKLKIGKGKKTKRGYSTSAEVLESLEDAHPIVKEILEYRHIQKLNSTYIEGLKPLIDVNTGLINTSFNQTVTSTGRLSSKEPNLQNIPVRDEEGKLLRKFFVPKDENRVLISADYSQIELRLLAAFSGCKALIEGYKKGIDIHKITASKVFGVPLENVTEAQRSSAKAVNFGIIYGISEYGLAKNIKVSPAQARKYIDSYFEEYKEVKNYMEENVAKAKEKGYAITILGRRRYIRELSSSNFNVRQFGERAAMNMPLQGSSADIIKLAMLGVSKRLKQENLKSQLILQVHDELIIDAYEQEKERVKQILVEEMEGAVKLSVDLTVSVGEGKTWFDAK